MHKDTGFSDYLMDTFTTEEFETKRRASLNMNTAGALHDALVTEVAPPGHLTTQLSGNPAIQLQQPRPLPPPPPCRATAPPFHRSHHHSYHHYQEAEQNGTEGAGPDTSSPLDDTNNSRMLVVTDELSETNLGDNSKGA